MIVQAVDTIDAEKLRLALTRYGRAVADRVAFEKLDFDATMPSRFVEAVLSAKYNAESLELWSVLELIFGDRIGEAYDV